MAVVPTFLIITLFTALAVSSLTIWVASTSINYISPVRWVVAFLLPAFTSLYGVRRKSLDPSAGVLAFLVGYVLTLASGSFCVIMIVFFLTSSRLTKWRKLDKMRFEAKEDSGTARNWEQVLCNGFAATTFSLLYLYQSSGEGATPLIINPLSLHVPTFSSLAVIGAIACCCGDTWASEIGSVLGLRPILITTLRPVPRGTNGGVSWAGLLASTGGGLLIGSVYYITQTLLINEVQYTTNVGSLLTPQWVVIPLGTLGGLIGSLIDSLLGATLQYTGYDEKRESITHNPRQPNSKHISGYDIMSNSTVNLTSSCMTAILIPILAHVLV